MNTGLPAFRTLIPPNRRRRRRADAEPARRAQRHRRGHGRRPAARRPVAETRADIRVVTLQGAGNALCAGGDISMFEGAACAVRASLMDLFTPLNDFLVRVARMDRSGWRRCMASPQAPACR